MSQALSKEMPAATLQTIRSRYKCVRHLLMIATSTPQYWNDGPKKEESDGLIFTPRRFVVDGLTWGSLDQAGARIVIDNRDSVISNASYSEFLTGKLLTVGILVKREWEDQWEEVYEPISAEISDASGTAHTATLLLSGLNGFQRRSILRQADKSCRHIYKGRRCQYAGPELTCDRTFDSCYARGNAVHYGGWRFALEAGAVIKISSTGSQQLEGSSGTYQYVPTAPNTDENGMPNLGMGIGPDAVYDGVPDGPAIPGGQTS